jgi:hypothetical protein
LFDVSPQSVSVLALADFSAFPFLLPSREKGSPLSFPAGGGQKLRLALQRKVDRVSARRIRVWAKKYRFLVPDLVFTTMEAELLRLAETS